MCLDTQQNTIIKNKKVIDKLIVFCYNPFKLKKTERLKMENAIIPTENKSLEVAELLKRVVGRFLATLDTKEKTKQAYRQALGVFEMWITDKGYTNPTREQILEYKSYLQGKTIVADNGELKSYATNTVNLYLTAVKRFFTFLEAEKLFPNIARGIKRLKTAKGHLKGTLTKDEARRLVDGIERETLNGLRDFALINLMLKTGLRTVEVSRALIGDIGRESGETILRKQGKGRDSKDDFVMLDEKAYTPILDYLQARGHTTLAEPLFVSHSNRNKLKHLTTQSISRLIKERLKAVGLKTEKITAHSLRHTAGTNAYINGADVASIQKMLGHSNINTTMIYVHNVNRISNGAEKFIDF